MNYKISLHLHGECHYSNKLSPHLCCRGHGLLEARYNQHLGFSHPDALPLWILLHDETIRTFPNTIFNRTR